MKKYVFIHNIISNREQRVIKSFDTYEELDTYIGSIQDIIDEEESDYAMFYELDEKTNMYNEFVDHYSMLYGIKSITIN